MFLDSLRLWIDTEPRGAPEAMAVDEWLMEIDGDPVLRVYGWHGEWGTIGYFDKMSTARATYPGLEFVRRWTGGGTVDHRHDWAYTLMLPGKRYGGAETYRQIHGALAKALAEEGRELELSCGDRATGAAACFDNPVCFDLIDRDGHKLAGAGQRRSKNGMLHQGSVALEVGEEASAQRARRLAASLSENVREVTFDVPPDWLELTILNRYAHPDWNERRM